MKATKNKAPVPYFSLVRNYDEETNELAGADFYIFGDIASNRGGLSGLFQADSDQSSYDFVQSLSTIPEGTPITVHINSRGGEVSEGLAIYNTLKDRANVTTICEGFAASAASLIFCGGSVRVMQPASLLFIHRASMTAEGNSGDFEKAAQDLKTITEAAVAAYREAGVNIPDDELNTMLDAETWILPEDALRMGFATEIQDVDDADPETGVPHNDAMESIMKLVSEPKAKKAVPIPSKEDVEALSGKLDTFTAELGKYSDLEFLASKVLAAFNEDPKLYAKAVSFVSNFLATDPAPAPAKVENKGFFNFKKA